MCQMCSVKFKKLRHSIVVIIEFWFKLSIFDNSVGEIFLSYNLIFFDTRKSLFGGMLKPPPTNLQVQLINNNYSVSSTELIFSTFFSQFNILKNMTNEPIFLRFPQVIERTSFSKSTINRREKEGKFPKRIKWGNIVFWNSYEIEKFQKDPNGYFVGGTK